MPAAAQRTTPLYTDWRDRYELLGRLGSGGFAEVFEARDLVLDELVALKIVNDGRAMSGRVRREVEAAAALSHDNIVRLYDWFADGERSVLVWELVRGESLDRLRGELGARQVAAVAVELFDALASAHGQGIVHRDVKPQNVMLSDEGHVKVMDFGIARLLDADTLTGDGDVIGTVAYMSPEQASGRRVGPPSDVYSAGTVVFELFAGEHPLRGSTPAETLSNVAGARLPSLARLRPDLPERVVALVDAACAARPGERPTAAELSAAFDGLLRSDGIPARGLGRTGRLAQLPLGAAALAERAGGAALAALTSGAVLGSLPAYPQSWTLPLVAVGAAVWAVVPQAGLAWLLGVLAFPLFNVSLAVGAAYLVLALAVFLLARTRPIAALWPALALALVPLHLALLAPASAAVLGRVRGPLAAAWAGACTFVFLLLVRAPAGPLTLGRPRGTLAAEASAAGDPFAVAVRVGAQLFAAPCLTQAALWAGLAAAIGFAATRRRLTVRLWVWALVFAGVYCVYAVVPVVAWGAAPPSWALAWSVAGPAAVILFPLVLRAAGAAEEAGDESLQVD